MKTFVDFIKTGNLSGARIVGYADNKEMSISFESLAAAVGSYLQLAAIQTPTFYRFDANSSVTIKNTNTTYALYLSSSVENLDIHFPDGNWINFWKAEPEEGSPIIDAYGVYSYTEALSVNKDVILPGEWVYVKNTTTNSIYTVYFQQTGSGILTVEPCAVAGDPPAGIPQKKVEGIKEGVQIHKDINFVNWLDKAYKEFLDAVHDGLVDSDGSGSDNEDSDDCKKFKKKWNDMKDKIDKAHEDLKNYTSAEDWSNKFSVYFDANMNFIEEYSKTDDNPCNSFCSECKEMELNELTSRLDELLDKNNKMLDDIDRKNNP